MYFSGGVVSPKKPVKLKIEFKMKPGERLTASGFVKGIKGFLGVINATEKSLTGEKARIKWKIMDLGMTEDSYFLEIEA